MAELIKDSIDESGAGYADEKIENSTGVGQVSSAVEGYNPYDGTYTYKKGTKWKQSGPDFKPINTGDKEMDELNAGYNQALANYLTDPAMKSAIYKYDPEYGGHGDSDYRDELDQFMLQEFGRSKYDSALTAHTSEEAKFNRADNQTYLGRIVADGVPRLTGRAAFMIAGSFTQMLRMGLNSFTSPVFRLQEYLKTGETPDRVDNPIINYFDYVAGPEAMTQYNDKFVDVWENRLGEGTYATEAEENAMAEHPLSGTALKSHKNIVELIDNIGYSAGAALVGVMTGGAATAVMAGSGIATATEKAMIDEDTGKWKSWQHFLPAIAGATAVTMSKYLPGPFGKAANLVFAGVASATSEAETEAIHAEQEYLQEKSQVLKNEINKRKQQISEYYAVETANATTEEERQEIEKRHQDQLRVLDWEYTMALNQAVQDASDMKSPIRLINYAVLTASNIIQFGKLFTGGAKTFVAQGEVAMREEAEAAARTAYKKEMSKAGWNPVERFKTWQQRDVIKAEALTDFEKRTGKKIFDETDKLSTAEKIWLGIKIPAAEGTEEISQSAAANYGKRTAEVNTDRFYERIAGIDAANADDYFGQIRSLAPFRKAESSIFDAMKYLIGAKDYDSNNPNSTYEGLNAFAGTFTNESAWYEFMAGAVMGAFGVPFLRSPRFKRSTGERSADGKIHTVTHWQSPIFLQGGIINEIKAESYKRKMMGEMARRLNKAMTEEERKKLLKRWNFIAHHAQYDDDKEAAEAENENSNSMRYTWQNAEDADILKSVELFQNTGQLDLLRAMVNSQLGYDTAAELRSLQALTSDVDEKGNKVGPYSEFDLNDVGENASEAEKKALADNVSKMKEKVKKNTDKLLHAIDTYDKARQELLFETKQGLTDDQLNCLTWYKVRLSQFDKRTKDMFVKHKGNLEALNSKMGDFFKESKADLEKDISTIKNALSANLAKEKKESLEGKLAHFNYLLRMMDLAQEEWTDRWERMSKETDPLKQARILFAGNNSADPISFSRVKEPWYMPNKQWAKRVKESMGPAAERRQALMGMRLDYLGQEAQVSKGILDFIIEDLAKPTSESDISKALKDTFSDDTERREFATALNDMRQCQAAIVRFKDLYQFYKDNPYAMTARQQQEKARIEEEAKQEEVKQQESELAKAKTVAEMYDIIRNKLVNGENVEAINAALDNLIKSGNKIAKQLLKNQEYVRAFAAALDSIKLSENKLAETTGQRYTQAYVPLLKEIIIDAARECTSVDKMHEYLLSKIEELTSSPETLTNYFYDKGIFEKPEDEKSLEKQRKEFLYVLNLEVFLYKSKNGKWVLDKTNKETNISRAKKFLPEVVKIVDKRIRESDFNKSKYSFGESTSQLPLEKVQLEAAGALMHEEDKGHREVIGKITKFGDLTQTANSTKTATQEAQAQPQETKSEEKSETKKEESVQEKKDSDLVEWLDEQHRDEPVDEDMAEDDKDDEETPAADAAKEDAKEEVRKSRDKSVWRPIMAFFNLAWRKSGLTIRNNRVKKASGEGVAKTPMESWCGKFFAMLEKLNVFNAIDEVKRGEAGAVQVGEEVYFIVDKMGQDGKSEIFGLNADDIEYDGTPHIFMAVKRGSTYQCIGTMATNPAKLNEYGQATFANMVRSNAAESNGAYIHTQTAKVKKLNSGLVEVQEKENTLDRVYGGMERVRIVAKGSTQTYAYQAEDQSVDMSGARNGRLYAVVTDNATGKDRLMPIHTAHFNATDAKELGKTSTWESVESLLKEIVNAAQSDSMEVATSSMNQAYAKLNNVLALMGYGIHIDVIEKDGKRSIIVSQTVYENGEPKPFVVNGETQYRKIGDDYELDENGEKIPLYERDFVNIKADGKNALANLRAALMKLNPPFRVKLSDIKNQNLSTLITEGIIHTNIVDNGGLCTRGGYAEVDASMLQIEDKRKPGQESEQQRGEGSVQTQAELTRQNGQVEEFKIGDHTFAIDRSKDTITWKKWDGVDYVNVELTGDEAKAVRRMIEGDSDFRVAKDFIEGRPTTVFYEGEFGMTSKMTIGSSIKLDIGGFLNADIERSAEWFYHLSKFESILKQKRNIKIDDLNGMLFNIAMKDEDENAIVDFLRTLRNDMKEAGMPFDEDMTNAVGFYLSVELQEMFFPLMQSLKETEQAEADMAENKSETEAETTAAEESDNHDESDNETTETTESEESETETEKEDEEEEEEIESAAPSINEGSEGGESISEASIESDDDTDDLALSVFTQEDQSKPKADYAKEIAVLRKAVPFLTREDAVMIVNGLIETGRKGVLAQGKFRDGLMILSREGVRGTAFHEAFHGVFRLALSKEQQTAMLKEAKRLAKTERDSEAEEWLADAFRDYMVDQVYQKSWTRRIKDFFRSLFHLVSMPHYRRSPLCHKIFSDINKGMYREAGSKVTLTTLKDLRMSEYKQMDLDSAAIAILENARSGYSARTAEERSMLRDAGISEEAFDHLTPNRREEVIRCL